MQPDFSYNNVLPCLAAARRAAVSGWHDTRIVQMKNVQADFVRFTAAIALGLLAATMPASVHPAAAQTARQACTSDAFRLCSNTIPDERRTKACLARNRASLSTACRAAFGGGGPGGRRHRHRRG
jgi:hypothetical protein